MGDYLLGVCRTSVAASVRLDQFVFAHEVVSAAVYPVFVATGAAVQQQQRFTFSFDLVVQLDAVE